MKTTIAVCSAAIMLSAVTFRAGAEIIAGPVTNPANGHDYYLLAPESWPAAEAEAENLGGTLVIIRNADEQKWIFAKFGHDGNKERSLWIGLHRQWQGGPFIWMDGSRLDYANWCSGQPDNGGGVENCVHMWADAHNGGGWNDAVENTSLYAVVEVPGKSDEKALTEKEKSLIGNWYESGRPDRQAWIAGTDNKLFLITHDRHAARLTFMREGVLYDADRQFGEIVKDRILWSNGTWWSRKPAEYKTKEISSDKNTLQLPSGSMTD
jgi:hypothetical protein